MPEHKFADGIAWFWEEVERVATTLSGPLLIVSTLLAVVDIFSNNQFDRSMSWLSLVWAVAKGAAIAFWIGPAFERMLTALGNWQKFGWFLLFLALGVIDIQSTLVYGLIAAHISDYGILAFLNIPQIDWIIEQGVMGFVLIGVHRALIYKKTLAAPANAPASLETLAQAFAGAVAHAVTERPLARPTTQPVEEAPGILRRGAPTARRAYYAGPVAPLMMDDEEEGGGVIEFVSEDDAGLSRHTPKARARRRDAGSESSAKEQRVQKLMAQLRITPKMSIEDVREFLSVSRGTAVTARQEARRRLADEKRL